jgi:hypothetical protein
MEGGTIATLQINITTCAQPVNTILEIYDI